MLKELILESRYKNYNYDKEILNTANEFLDSFANMIIDKYLLKLKSHFPFIKSKYDLILAYIMYKTKTTQNKTGKSSIIFSASGFKSLSFLIEILILSTKSEYVVLTSPLPWNLESGASVPNINLKD